MDLAFFREPQHVFGVFRVQGGAEVTPSLRTFSGCLEVGFPFVSEQRQIFHVSETWAVGRVFAKQESWKSD